MEEGKLEVLEDNLSNAELVHGRSFYQNMSSALKGVKE